MVERNTIDMFFDPNERENVLLGRNRYVYVSLFAGKKSLHIRRLKIGSGGRLTFTKEGVNLTKDEWYDFRELLSTAERFVVS